MHSEIKDRKTQSRAKDPMQEETAQGPCGYYTLV